MFKISLYRSMPSFCIKVVPGASRDAVLGEKDQCVKISIAASPEKDKANNRLIRFLADSLEIKQSQIHIVQGQKSRNKLVAFSECIAEDMEKKIACLLQEGKK
ncbi:MAG: DUF167 domain-containing protein [Candidatus Brocadiae bacterium]|nr:DUF167 domain-containing protein [Candidatus Brocadiia bacterium]